MTTSFEFIPPKRRRIGFGKWTLVPFCSSVLILSLAVWFLKEDTHRVQDEFKKEATLIEARKAQLISKILTQTPDSQILTDLEESVRKHNFALIGRNISWSLLFETLEKVLPEDAVIAQILNAKSGKAVFTGEDNKFKLLVIVRDSHSNKSFYQKLSAEPCFSSLSFTPHGEQMFQGVKGVAIELIFSFEEKI